MRCTQGKEGFWHVVRDCKWAWEVWAYLVPAEQKDDFFFNGAKAMFGLYVQEREGDGRRNAMAREDVDCMLAAMVVEEQGSFQGSSADTSAEPKASDSLA